MALGKRISSELERQGKKPVDLCAMIPDLNLGTLCALIARDSRRSELDEKIAAALGVSLLWLVYGYEEKKGANEPSPPPYNAALSPDEQRLVEAFRTANANQKNIGLMWANTILSTLDLKQRTGTN